MTITQIVEKYESEIADIDAKIGSLNERKAFVKSLLKEIRHAAGSAMPKATRAAAPKASAAPASSPAPAGKKKPRKARKKRRGSPSARTAILQVVGDAPEPVTAAAIIDGAAALSGGKASSIRTQLNALTKAGSLKQVPFSGRGFKYTLPK
jgi:hypothetical protein